MAAARAALICPLATAPVMGTTVNQRAAMVVASPSFVVVLANNFATIPKMIASLSGFGAMSSSWPQIGCRSCQVRRAAITLWANRKKLENTSACWPIKRASQRCEITFPPELEHANASTKTAKLSGSHNATQQKAILFDHPRIKYSRQGRASQRKRPLNVRVGSQQRRR